MWFPSGGTPESLPRAPEALLRSHGARVSKIMPSESLGVTLGAQVGHLVTYRDPLEGALLYTMLTKECQKRSKKGYPLFLTGFELAPPT